MITLIYFKFSGRISLKELEFMKKISNELLQKFKEHLQYEEKSQATVEKYLRDVSMFGLWCNGRELNKNLMLEYKKTLVDAYAPASVNSIISSINSFLAYNEWHELKVKLLKIQRQIFSNREKELTKAEYERLLIAARKKQNERLYFLMQTICSSGIRVSELKFITVEALKKGQTQIRNKGKIRVVILPKELCKMLMTYAKKEGITEGTVFITKTGKPLDRSTIWKMMKSLCDSAGVSKTKVFPHNLRHLFAKTYYSIQKDIVRLADILGHSSINTTRIYTVETGEIHRRQIQKLGLLKS